MIDDAERQLVAGQVGANLRRLRKKADLTRDELAERAGVGHSHISKIETGGKLCGLVVLVRVASSLGATPNDLLDGIDWEPIEQDGGGMVVTPFRSDANE